MTRVIFIFDANLHHKKTSRKKVTSRERRLNSVMRFQIQPRLNSMAHARQVHRGRIVSKCRQLTTTASWPFLVTNTSLYVEGAICAVSEERRVRNYEAPAPVCRQLNGLRSDRSVVDLSRVRSGFGQSRSLVPPVLTTCSFLKNDVF